MLDKQAVIIIYGPPGSGKGTQAKKLADYLDLEHFDTGRIIEKKVYNPESQNDPIIQREKANFEKGLVCTSEWVAEIVKEGIKKVHQTKKGIVFSGSPRTLHEAKEIIPILEDLYGKDNIRVLRLNIRPKTSIFRNSHRRICQKCGYAVVYSPENEKLEECSKCGGKLVRRILDKPEIIKVRLGEYKEGTEPIFEFLAERGIKIIDIDGELPVEEVYQNILKFLK